MSEHIFCVYVRTVVCLCARIFSSMSVRLQLTFSLVAQSSQAAATHVQLEKSRFVLSRLKRRVRAASQQLFMVQPIQESQREEKPTYA